MILVVDADGHVARFEARPNNAAHSMDTDWYAVDRDGHVAQLWSDEEGAVPWDAHRQYWAELYEDLALARGAALLATTDERQVFTLDPQVHVLAPGQLPFRWNGALRFAGRDYLEMFRAEHYHPEWGDFEGLPHTVLLKDILKTVFDDYWAAGAIVSAYVSGSVVPPRSLGLFEYSCSFSGPYRRTAVPAQAVLLDALPAPLRDRLGMLRISKLSFNTTSDFDPDDFLSCHKYR